MPQIVMLGIIALATIWIFAVVLRRLRRPLRFKTTADNRPVDIDPKNLPPVSVIVYCRDNTQGLVALTGQLLSQDYEAVYEIVAVIDGQSDSANEALARLSMHTDRLRHTFVPDRSHNISRKKLAITLGMKAARYPYALLLDASSRLSGDGWMRAMASNFVAGYKVVLGNAVVVPAEGCAHMSAFRSLDEGLTAATWMGAAMGRCPYRGNGYNIGYARELFFEKKGFAASLNLTAGDDDIFINSITDRFNTTVELSDASRVEVVSDNVDETYRRLRVSHIFTGEKLPKAPRRVTASLSYALWLSMAIAGLVVYFTLPQWWPAAVAVALVLTQWVVLSLSLHRVMEALGISIKRRYIVPGLLWRPVTTMHLKLLSRKDRHMNYAWASDSRFATRTLGKKIL